MEEENNASAHLKEVTRLWRAWRTVHEMVQDRVCKLLIRHQLRIFSARFLHLFYIFFLKYVPRMLTMVLVLPRATNWLKMK